MTTAPEPAPATEPDESKSWTRMENLVNAAVEKGLKGWSPAVTPSSPVSVTPPTTPATEPTPETTPPTAKKTERKRGFLSDFFQGLGD